MPIKETTATITTTNTKTMLAALHSINRCACNKAFAVVVVGNVPGNCNEPIRLNEQALKSFGRQSKPSITEHSRA